MSKTNTAANGKLQYEAMAAMTDSGDHTTFSLTGATLWSQRSGYEPVVRPDGLITGGAVTPGAANDTVAVAGLTCYLAGVEKTVVADAAFAITRPAASPAGQNKISSITVNSAGSLAEVQGTEHTDFSATRGAAGGPPLIPAGSIEIAQVKMSDGTAALFTASEIFQVIGTHCERWDYPVWDEDVFSGEITFASALPATHAGSPATYKLVYAEVYEPVFSDVEPVADFKPPENTYSVSSTQVYGGTVGASSQSLGQGSFKVYVKDGISEAISKLAGENLFFKFFPDRNKAPYKICQGILGIGSTYPAGANIQLDCTISATEAAQGVES
jgi:hypothetical protein